MMKKNLTTNFEGKVVMVTAASRGIGYGAAKEFSRAGARIAICARDKTSLNQAKEEILGFAPKDSVFALAGDVSQTSFLTRFHTEAVQFLGESVDILVNNCGGPATGSAIEFSDEDWQKAIESNFMSVVRLVSLVVPGMKKKNFGRIINLTSTTAKEPAPNMVLSNVTRAAVASYSKTLSKELGPDGITMNTILTGGCKTSRFYELIEKQAQAVNRTVDEIIEEHEQNVPVRFFSTPEQFAQSILFLASTEASYLTGISLPVDGGSSQGMF